MKEGDGSLHAIAYWKATSGREIDFLVKPQRDLLPIEVKWSEHSSAVSHARRAIMATFAAGMILTRNLMDLEHAAPAVPTSCFLYFLRDSAPRIEP